MRRGKQARSTPDMGRQISDETGKTRCFRIETMRWQRLVWTVQARDRDEAELRFDDGEAVGPHSVQDEGHEIVEVTRMN